MHLPFAQAVRASVWSASAGLTSHALGLSRRVGGLVERPEAPLERGSRRLTVLAVCTPIAAPFVLAGSNADGQSHIIHGGGG